MKRTAYLTPILLFFPVLLTVSVMSGAANLFSSPTTAFADSSNGKTAAKEIGNVLSAVRGSTRIEVSTQARVPQDMPWMKLVELVRRHRWRGLGSCRARANTSLATVTDECCALRSGQVRERVLRRGHGLLRQSAATGIRLHHRARGRSVANQARLRGRASDAVGDLVLRTKGSE
jgi:hypothetical protein